MKTLNLSFAAIFFILAIAAFFGAILAQAYWHLGTMILCLALTVTLYNEGRPFVKS